jgi:hypothetical protein
LKKIKTLSLIRKHLLDTNVIRVLCRQNRFDVKKRLFADSSSLVLLVVFKISESKKLSISKKAPIASIMGISLSPCRFNQLVLPSSMHIIKSAGSIS